MGDIQVVLHILDTMFINPLENMPTGLVVLKVKYAT